MRIDPAYWYLTGSPQMRRVRFWWFDYRLMRGYGNGRAQSLWKAWALIRGRRVRISPRYWSTPVEAA